LTLSLSRSLSLSVRPSVRPCRILPLAPTLCFYVAFTCLPMCLHLSLAVTYLPFRLCASTCAYLYRCNTETQKTHTCMHIHTSWFFFFSPCLSPLYPHSEPLCLFIFSFFLKKQDGSRACDKGPCGLLMRTHISSYEDTYSSMRHR
jgi:hypothetical protein